MLLGPNPRSIPRTAHVRFIANAHGLRSLPRGQGRGCLLKASHHGCDARRGEPGRGRTGEGWAPSKVGGGSCVIQLAGFVNYVYWAVPMMGIKGAFADK